VDFRSFLGNPDAVRHLQEMQAADRLPHALLLAGGRGAGKYSLALALAQTIHCLHPRQTNGLPDACGACSNCTRIAEASDLEARTAEAIEAREQLREADRKDTRILIQTHPDVLVLPPDPPQFLVKVGQVRSLIHDIQRLPSEGRRKLYIFPNAVFMNEAANSLLKVLEEPPPYAHILLLSENPNDLLPTIRSRTSLLRLHPLPLPQMELVLAAQRPAWAAKQRALVARLAEGAVGRALSFDLEAYLATRKDALLLLRSALDGTDHSALFRATESYRAGHEGQQKTQELLRALYSLLEDLLLLQAGAPNSVRNIDLEAELRQLAPRTSFSWLEQAARAIGEVESGMRRNLLRSLSLDALVSQMGNGA
jgi:DNA polymerase-3 subunit delta'